MKRQKLNLGPSSIAQSGLANGPSFALSRTEWYAIQVYTNDALALPINEEQFRSSLGDGAPKDLSDFAQLIRVYDAMNEQAFAWSKDTYPSTVRLASDVYHYGENEVPIYYPKILDYAAILQKDPNNKEAQAALKALLDSLEKKALDYANQAQDAFDKVLAFARKTEENRSTLTGNDGKGGLLAYYDKKYGQTSADVVELNKKIEEQRAILKKANDRYHHDVVVASTAATYAWVWPIGTVAAAVVAGIYGKDATTALAEAKAAQEKIDKLTDDLAADANLMNCLHFATGGITSMSEDISRALPEIQKIQGVWGGMADDLRYIADLIVKDIAQVPPIIMDLGVEEAMREWGMVAKEADDYRKNAYITPSSAAAREAWWLSAILLPRAHHTRAHGRAHGRAALSA